MSDQSPRGQSPALIGRILPHSIEAEENLLSACMLDGADVLSRCLEARIKPESFYDSKHGIIYDCLCCLLKSGKPTDSSAVAEELKTSRQLDQIGGYAFLSQVSSRIPTTAQAAYFIDKVREQALLREIIVAGALSVEECYGFTGEIDKLVGGIGSRMQALVDQAQASGSDAKLRAARLQPDVQPPDLRVVFSLAGIPIATPGNLVGIYAQAKAGKTAFVGAAIGATFTESQNCDFLGLAGANPKALAVVHLDTEQAPADHWRVVRTAMRRAQIESAPTWLHSYATAGWSPRERLIALPRMLRIAKAECGGVHSVMLDGLADFINDPNAGDECFPFIDSLQALAVEYDCPIFTILHLNPGSEKSRGHLGSQLERRAETNLILDRDPDSGRTVVYSTKQRRAPILKADGPCFRWDDKEHMHVAVETVRSERDAQAANDARELVNEVFGTSSAMGYTALLSAIKTACGCSERTAGRKFDAMRTHKIITRFPPNLWSKAA